MDYNLNKKEEKSKGSVGGAFKKMLPLLGGERKNVIIAFVGVLLNAGLTLLGPLIIGYVIDTFIPAHDYHGVLVYSGILFGVYLGAYVSNYIQIRFMGTVAQNVLFKLRNDVFTKLQSLPIAFFNQNKAGDLISRINNDTDKLNQFFSQGLMQFAGSFFLLVGAAIFLLVLNFKLGAAALAPALGVLIFTQLISAWVKRTNFVSLQAGGLLSAEIQESLENFKVVLAFNRCDYFRDRFEKANRENFKTSINAGIGNNLFTPVYGLAGTLAQLIVLAYGIILIAHGQLAIGLLISFILYINRFYDPLRQIAQLWSSLQLALAGWDRIAQILNVGNDMQTLPTPASETRREHEALLQFKDVSFGYPGGKQVLHGINISLECGKTYALVGPTGGGKTTTASLMARLYDPTEGEVLLGGRDIRTYQPEERTQKIGFILQEPFLFTGTLRDNIIYGNPKFKGLSAEQIDDALSSAGFADLLKRFDKGVDTEVGGNDSLSLGQRQLIAFMRAVLREPEILILDEATANIDTITEKLLDDVLNKLPSRTTRVIIAHRLNTIENADEIFFVNGGSITPAGSMEHAVEMLLHGKRQS